MKPSQIKEANTAYNIRSLFLVKIQLILCWFLSVVFNTLCLCAGILQMSEPSSLSKGTGGWLSKHRLIMVASNQWHAMVYTTLVEVYKWGMTLSLPWYVGLELFELLACTACFSFTISSCWRKGFFLLGEAGYLCHMSKQVNLMWVKQV